MFDLSPNEVGAQKSDFHPSSGAIAGNARPSTPAPGRTLGALVIGMGQPIRDAVAELINSYEGNGNDVGEIFSSTILGPGAVVEGAAERLAWFVVNATASHAYFSCRHSAADFNVALNWFFAENSIVETILTSFSEIGIARAEKALSQMVFDDASLDLSPYLMEPHGHVSRRLREVCSKARTTRSNKRANGVFYTPSDVADFLVKKISDNSGLDRSWLDPACGSGVLLKSVLDAKKLAVKGASVSQRCEYIQEAIFGIDKSALSTDSCAFVLLNTILYQSTAFVAPYAYWQLIKSNIVCADALQLLGHTKRQDDCSGALRRVFPNLISTHFDCLIQNPPYSPVIVDKNLRNIWRSYEGVTTGASAPAYLAFAEMMVEYVHDEGYSGAVLPLSIAANTNKAHKRLRDLLFSSGGCYEFLFYDREPQALFGEDIKTRNALVFRKPQKSRFFIKTSRLLKWTAAQRSRIFDRNPVAIAKSCCENFIPKLACQKEVSVYSVLLRNQAQTKFEPTMRRATLDALMCEEADACKKELLVGGTAYNYLNVYFLTGVPKRDISDASRSPINVLSFQSECQAYAAYAILASRLSFWLWHVEGDGFHVTTSFLKRLPLWSLLDDLELTESISKLGQDLWRLAMSSVHVSLNAGRQTCSFHAGYQTDLLLKIDRRILEAIGLDPEFLATVESFVDATVSIDGQPRSARELEIGKSLR